MENQIIDLVIFLLMFAMVGFASYCLYLIAYLINKFTKKHFGIDLYKTAERILNA